MFGSPVLVSMFLGLVSLPTQLPLLLRATGYVDPMRPHPMRLPFDSWGSVFASFQHFMTIGRFWEIRFTRNKDGQFAIAPF